MSSNEITTQAQPDLLNTLAKFESVVADAKRIASVIEAAAKIPITTPEERSQVFEIAKEGNTLLKQVETLRTTLVKPYNDHVKAINDFAKGKLSQPIEQSIGVAKSAIKAFDDEQERQQAAERKRLADEQAERDRLAREEADRIERDRLEALRKVEDDARAERERIEQQEAGEAKERALEDLRAKELEDASKVNAAADSDSAYNEIVGSAVHSDIASATAALDNDVGRGRQKRWAFEVTDMAALFAARPDLVKAEPRTREITGEITAGVREIPGIRIFEDTSVVLR